MRNFIDIKMTLANTTFFVSPIPGSEGAPRRKGASIGLIDRAVGRATVVEKASASLLKI